MIPFLSSIKSVVDTILARIPSNNTTLVGRLDDTVSSRAPASTALSTAVWTSARAAQLDAVGIKSVQHREVTVTVAAGVTTGTLADTISAVNTAKTILIVHGPTTTAATGISANARAKLDSSTQVTVTVGMDNTRAGVTNYTVNYTVLEFN